MEANSWRGSLKRRGWQTVFRSLVGVCMCMLCFAVTGNDENRDNELFVSIDERSVPFPDIATTAQSVPTLTTRTGEWTFSVQQEPSHKVLLAESTDVRVSQSITQNSVFKRFVFDLKRQRFEPMRQEIRIELADERNAQRIEQLNGVSNVKHFERLGFAIVIVDTEVDPVSVLRVLRREFESTDARILTGFSDNEPM